MPAFVTLLISPLTWMWKAFVLVKVWAWFMVPAGAPRLGFVTAMAVALIVSILTPLTRVPDDKPVDTKWAVSVVSYGFMAPLAALAFGWGLHLFTA